LADIALLRQCDAKQNKTHPTQYVWQGTLGCYATGNLHIVAMPCNQAQQDGMVTAGSSVPEAANVVNLPQNDSPKYKAIDSWNSYRPQLQEHKTFHNTHVQLAHTNSFQLLHPARQYSNITDDKGDNTTCRCLPGDMSRGR
jgi:hypothetical protein